MTAEQTRPGVVAAATAATAAAPQDVIVVAERAMGGVESSSSSSSSERTHEALFEVLAAMSAFEHQHHSERAELVASVRRRQHGFEIGQ